MKYRVKNSLNVQNLAATAAEYKHADVTPNCDVTTSSDRKRSLRVIGLQTK